MDADKRGCTLISYNDVIVTGLTSTAPIGMLLLVYSILQIAYLNFGVERMSKVTTKFQITIPKEIRKAMNIMPGTDVGFKQEADKFYLIKNNKINPFDKWCGTLKLKKTADEIMSDLRGYGIESID